MRARERKNAEVTNFTLSNINDFVGRELGVSSWMTVDQPLINQFANCTGERQWIHVDVDRAKRESPFRGTIAHGYLTLSLVAPLAMEGHAAFVVREDYDRANYLPGMGVQSSAELRLLTLHY